jgi:hypothetical protein
MSVKKAALLHAHDEHTSIELALGVWGGLGKLGAGFTEAEWSQCGTGDSLGSEQRQDAYGALRAECLIGLGISLGASVTLDNESSVFSLDEIAEDAGHLIGICAGGRIKQGV